MIEPNNWSVEKDPSGFTVKYNTGELKNPMEEKGTYQVTGKKTFKEILESPEMEKCREAIAEAEKEFAKEAENWWNDLSYDDQLKAFFYVTSMIHKGDVEEQGSYRHVLYSVFSFDMDSYVVGMNSGYLEIHNLIYDGIEYNKIKNAKSIIFGDNTIVINDKSKIDFAYDENDKSLTLKEKDLFNCF